MAQSWFYVENNDRVGPVAEEKLVGFIEDGKLNEESFVWRKGLANWLKLKDVKEFEEYFQEAPAAPESNETEELEIDFEEELKVEDEKPQTKQAVAPVAKKAAIDWNNIPADKMIFTIKIGLDRGSSETEYGPYSMNLLKKLFSEKRINGKTLLFMPGMENWTLLADLPVFENVFAEIAPTIDEKDRRINIRKPFVAKMLFHNNSEVFEGICRDVSIGGLQVLVAAFPGKVGDVISMNVHPDNSEYGFVASGKVVRIFDGEQGLSIRFQNLSEEAKTAINSYINQS